MQPVASRLRAGDRGVGKRHSVHGSGPLLQVGTDWVFWAGSLFVCVFTGCLSVSVQCHPIFCCSVRQLVLQADGWVRLSLCVSVPFMHHWMY